MAKKNTPPPASMSVEANTAILAEEKHDEEAIPVVEAYHPTSSGDKKKKKGSPAIVDHASPPRTLVAESETVRPEVAWKPEQRVYTDKIWAGVYLAVFLAWLACGLTLVGKAHARYEWFPTENATTRGDGFTSTTSQTVRVVAPHYQTTVQQCCASKPYNEQVHGDFSSLWDLCSELTVDESANRRRARRSLQGQDEPTVPEEEYDATYEDDGIWGGIFDENKVPTSKFEYGQGMFDAFMEAPGIPITLCLMALALALLWVVLIKFFATPIVFLTEAVKVAFFIYLFITGLQHRTTGSAVVALLCAFATVAWDIYTYKQLIFAGKILSHAAQSFRENMTMFCAFLPLLGIYALNAYLFVLFYAKSFEVVEVQQINECYMSYDISYPEGDDFNNYNNYEFNSQQQVEHCMSQCVYTSPSYTTGMIIFISIAYLWSVLLFHTMRLSIIATIIGAWHFHADDAEKPGVVRAIVNTCTTSLGTLSVASLISTIAGRFYDVLLFDGLLTEYTSPLNCHQFLSHCFLNSSLKILQKSSIAFCCKKPCGSSAATLSFGSSCPCTASLVPASKCSSSC